MSSMRLPGPLRDQPLGARVLSSRGPVRKTGLARWRERGWGPFLLDSNTHEATRARIGYYAGSGRRALPSADTVVGGGLSLLARLRSGSDRRAQRPVCQGSIRPIPVRSKSLMLRVARVASWMRQIAAICA